MPRERGAVGRRAVRPTAGAGRAAGAPVISSPSRPELAPHVRLTFDRAREHHVLLGPESVVVLNRTGADILNLCDGQRTVAEIVEEMHGRYERVVENEVRDFLDRLVAKRCVEVSDG